MRYLPVMLDLAGRRALVVGGGAVATRKISRLIDAGAQVRVVAIRASAPLREMAAREERLELLLRPYRSRDLKGVCLVFRATGRPEVEQEVWESADRAGLWVNAADDHEHCSFLLPAILERGPLLVAVGTGGASPALAVRVRDEIAASLGSEYTAAAELLGGLRRSLPPSPARGRALAELLDGGLLEALRQGDRGRVERLVDEARRGLVRAASGGGDGGV